MVDKAVPVQRSMFPAAGNRPRPRMLAIGGDSASGKTTLARGLSEALGPRRCVTVCVGDYHRYDREERRHLPFTPLHPACNYVEIMEQHLQLLACGQPILKPVYDHSNGGLTRPELVEPREFVIVEGPLCLHTRAARACFDVSAYLAPPEAIRHRWKVTRDIRERGYTAPQVLAELERREAESEAFIRPQRRWADIVVRFAPIETPDEPRDAPLSATLLLRPTIRHHLTDILTPERTTAMHLAVARDDGGDPVDALHIHGLAPPEESRVAEKLLWEGLGRSGGVPQSLGLLDGGVRSEPLALVQLVLLSCLVRNAD